MIGEARITERELRLLNRESSEIISVRLGAKTRAVFAHQRPIGMVRARAANSLRRPTWSLTDPNGEVVATVSEASALGTVGRRSWKVIAELGAGTHAPPGRLVVRAGAREVGRIEYDRLDLGSDVERNVDRRLILAAWLALRLDTF